jgi:hypothetical protein
MTRSEPYTVQEILDAFPAYIEVESDTANKNVSFDDVVMPSFPPDIDMMKGALKCIDPDCDYDMWFKIGAACRASGLGKTALDAWDDWSSQGDKYKPGECQYKWQTIDDDYKGERITLGTLYHYAKENGWNWEPYQYTSHEISEMIDQVGDDEAAIEVILKRISKSSLSQISTY